MKIPRSPTDEVVVTSQPVAPLARLPLIAALLVFVPIILTSLTPVLLHPATAPIIAAYPAFPFLLYSFWNWSLIIVGCLILRHLGIGWRNIGRLMVFERP